MVCLQRRRLFLCLLLVSVVDGNQLSLTHGLTDQGGLIVTHGEVKHVTYVSLKEWADLTSTIEEHLGDIEEVLKKGLAHLGATTARALIGPGRKYYVLLKDVTTENAEAVCNARGGKLAKYTNPKEWTDLTKLVQKFNNESAGGEVERVEEVLVPVIKLDNKWVQLDDNTTEVAFKLSQSAIPFNSEEIAPRYVIENQDYDFPISDNQTNAICEPAFTDNIMKRSVWKMMALSMERRVLKLRGRLQEAIKDVLEGFSTEGTVTKESVLFKTLRVEEDCTVLNSYQTELSEYDISDEDDVNAFRAGEAFFDQYLDEAQSLVDRAMRRWTSEDNLVKEIREWTRLEIAEHLNGKLAGGSEATLYQKTLLARVRYEKLRYDRSNQMIRSVGYYPDVSAKGIYVIREITKLPFVAGEKEMTIATPSDLLIWSQAEGLCTFSDYTQIDKYCTRSGGQPPQYICEHDSAFQVNNKCCEELVTMNYKDVVSNCSTVIFEDSPKLIHFGYEGYGLLLVQSRMDSEEVVTKCGDGEKKLTLNETSLIKTDCGIQYKHEVWRGTNEEGNDVIIKPLSELFNKADNELKDMKVEVKFFQHDKGIEVSEADDVLEWYGLEWYVWVLSGAVGLVVSVSTGCCGCVTRLAIKNRQHKRREREMMLENFQRTNASAPPNYDHFRNTKIYGARQVY